jgi:hypothetical protein
VSLNLAVLLIGFQSMVAGANQSIGNHPPISSGD